MSSQKAALLSNMRDGDDNLIWRQSLIAGIPNMLLGYAIAIKEGIPGPFAGNLAIGCGNICKLLD